MPPARKMLKSTRLPSGKKLGNICQLAPSTSFTDVKGCGSAPPSEEIVWSRVGLTHISFDVKNPYKWYDFLKGNGVEIVSEVEESSHGHAFFFVKDCDGNLIEIIDLRYRYPLLRYLGWFAGWLFGRGRYKKHYEPAA